ncbi:MAG: hypothetical protein V4684_06140 [Pseudomonadota bacterium]
MDEYGRYLVVGKATDDSAKEFLRAKINAERAFEHFGDVTDHFKKYVFSMGGHYQTLLDRLSLDLGAVAKSVLNGHVLTVERIARATVLSVPAELQPAMPALKRISEAQYQDMRVGALRSMGLDFGRFRTSPKNVNEKGVI